MCVALRHLFDLSRWQVRQPNRRKQKMQNSLNYGATLAQAGQYLRECAQFHTGTLSAEWELMSGNWLYVVRSYGTTIGTRTEAITSPHVFPSAYTFSATTSKHANLVKKAWGL